MWAKRFLSSALSSRLSALSSAHFVGITKKKREILCLCCQCLNVNGTHLPPRDRNAYATRCRWLSCGQFFYRSVRLAHTRNRFISVSVHRAHVSITYHCSIAYLEFKCNQAYHLSSELAGGVPTIVSWPNTRCDSYQFWWERERQNTKVFVCFGWSLLKQLRWRRAIVPFIRFKTWCLSPQINRKLVRCEWMFHMTRAILLFAKCLVLSSNEHVSHLKFARRPMTIVKL